MASEIKFEFDQITVKDIEKKLGRMKSEAPRVLKNALNKTAKDARRDLAKKAQETYAVKVGGFSSRMTIRDATTGNLEAVIETRGKPIEMRYFSHRGGRKGAPLYVTIIKGLQKSMGRRAFFNKISPKSQGGSGHMAIAKYTGKDGERGGYRPNRLGIEEKYSVSVPQMIGSKRRVYGVLEPNIQEHLRNNVDKQVSKILGR